MKIISKKTVKKTTANKNAIKNQLSKADLEKVKGGGGLPKQFSTLSATQEDRSVVAQ